MRLSIEGGDEADIWKSYRRAFFFCSFMIYFWDLMIIFGIVT